jgi:hypothetical protein
MEMDSKLGPLYSAALRISTVKQKIGSGGSAHLLTAGRFDPRDWHNKRGDTDRVTEDGPQKTNAAKRSLPDPAWRFGPTATLSGRGGDTLPAPVAS